LKAQPRELVAIPGAVHFQDLNSDLAGERRMIRV